MIGKLLGHTQVQTTARYAHLAAEPVRMGWRLLAPGLSLGRSDYQRQYEPILYGWADGTKHFWCGDRDQGDVWHHDRPVKNDLHPTIKPVALVERAIRKNETGTKAHCVAPSGGIDSDQGACFEFDCRAQLVDLSHAARATLGAALAP